MNCDLQLYEMECVLKNNEMLEDEYVFDENISTWLFFLDFRTTFNGPIVFSFTSANGGFVVTDAVAGKVVRKGLKLEFTPGTYYADLTITKAGGKPITLLRQQVTILNSYNNE